ncbi:MAG: BrnA antitoxin family protein, partial [Terriglobales bacterium]
MYRQRPQGSEEPHVPQLPRAKLAGRAHRGFARNSKLVTRSPWLEAHISKLCALAAGEEAIDNGLDEGVLAWLKRHGKGYQARINRILRVVMEPVVAECASLSFLGELSLK